MNKYRYVQYEDDGHCTYQCLACKAMIYSPSVESYKYCPYCACQWEGQHVCRPRSIPRWAYERGIDDYATIYNAIRPRWNEGYTIYEGKVDSSCVVASTWEDEPVRRRREALEKLREYRDEYKNIWKVDTKIFAVFRIKHLP